MPWPPALFFFEEKEVSTDNGNGRFLVQPTDARGVNLSDDPHHDVKSTAIEVRPSYSHLINLVHQRV